MTMVKRRTHPHSSAAIDGERRRGKVASRCEQILACIRDHGQAMIDREVRNVLRLDDMNSVRPRITELIDAGRLVECGQVRCPATGKQVRLVDIRAQQLRLWR